MTLVMDKPASETPPADTVRIGVNLAGTDYARLLSLRGKRRVSTQALVGGWIIEQLDKAEAAGEIP